MHHAETALPRWPHLCSADVVRQTSSWVKACHVWSHAHRLQHNLGWVVQGYALRAGLLQISGLTGVVDDQVSADPNRNKLANRIKFACGFSELVCSHLKPCSR